MTRRIPAPSAGQSTAPKAPSSPGAGATKGGWARFPRLDDRRRKDDLTIVIKYTGGPECWYVIKARGTWGRFPGHAAIHDVMQDIYGGR